jgi:osmoprotectant transport system permease protein
MTEAPPSEAETGGAGAPSTPAGWAGTGRGLRERLSLPRGVARHALMPVLLAVVLALLYVYVSSVELDRIEQRLLTWPGIRGVLIRHIQLAGVATGGIILIAVPLGIMLTRPWARRFTPVAVNVANAGQAIPSLGVLVLLFVWLRPEYGVSYFNIAVTALIIYGILPVLRNTLVGIRQIDPAEIEAGRGMGMRQRQVLWHIELPLAVPVILAGVRVSLILAVGTAALAVFIGAGGLGVLIQTGISLQRTPLLITGAVLTAVLALFADWLAGVVEDLLRPRGL